MLSKIYRITKDREYQTIYRRGRYQSTALFSVHYIQNKRGITRVGIVISKKITKKATERNRLKRQFREISRSLLTKMKPGYDVVITAKAGALDSKFETLQKTMLEAVTRAELSK